MTIGLGLGDRRDCRIVSGRNNNRLDAASLTCSRILLKVTYITRIYLFINYLTASHSIDNIQKFY